MTPAQQQAPAGQARLAKFRNGYLLPNNGYQQFYALWDIYPGTIDSAITINLGTSKALTRFSGETKFSVSFRFSKFDSEGLVGSVSGALKISP